MRCSILYTTMMFYVIHMVTLFYYFGDPYLYNVLDGAQGGGGGGEQ